jgi:2-phospho-L-lactate guanylyltransferase
MTTFAILPVKAFDSAKSRLSEAVGPGYRRTLAEAMYSDVLLALRRTPSIDHIMVVTIDRTAARIAGGQGITVLDDHGHSHSDAAEQGIQAATAQGASRVLLIAGDCPLLDPDELEQLLSSPTPERSALIVADRHGTGTNGLLLSPPGSLTPAFGEGSRDRHLQLAAAQGTTAEIVSVPTLELDVDTAEDLSELHHMLANTRGRAAHTRGMLNQMARSGQ